MFYACKLYDIQAYRQWIEALASAGGISARGAKEAEMSMVNHGMDYIMEHVVKAGKYDPVVMFKGGKVVHDQMLMAVFLRENDYLVYLGKRLLDKGKMYIVLPKMLSDRDPSTEKKLSCRVELPEVKTFLIKH